MTWPEVSKTGATPGDGISRGSVRTTTTRPKLTASTDPEGPKTSVTRKVGVSQPLAQTIVGSRPRISFAEAVHGRTAIGMNTRPSPPSAKITRPTTDLPPDTDTTKPTPKPRPELRDFPDYISVYDLAPGPTEREEAPSAASRIAALQEVQESLVGHLSSVQPGRSWYLPAEVVGVPVDFLVDPGAVVSAISREQYGSMVKLLFSRITHTWNYRRLMAAP